MPIWPNGQPVHRLIKAAEKAGYSELFCSMLDTRAMTFQRGIDECKKANGVLANDVLAYLIKEGDWQTCINICNDPQVPAWALVELACARQKEVRLLAEKQLRKKRAAAAA